MVKKQNSKGGNHFREMDGHDEMNEEKSLFSQGQPK